MMTDFEFQQYRLHREIEGKIISEISNRANVSLSDAIGIYISVPWLENSIFTTEVHETDDIDALVTYFADMFFNA